MKFERAYGKKLPYAYFGTGYQTEEKTKESLLQWVMAGDSVKSVAKTLGLIIYGKLRLILVLYRCNFATGKIEAHYFDIDPRYMHESPTTLLHVSTSL
ncbi:hypothetical protein JG687_00007278 [Phytophthora cactorum]|uniref:Uncharacterized protein n=1 Tax=Phytophthora cactorum TaxID=29920 RepID=A0A8T1UFY6_9STRA|nr:hypothetical protein JG687_00007278 [Phytophthora cactorum]